MRKETFICDRCKKEIKLSPLQDFMRLNKEYILISARLHVDLCEDCMQEFKEFMTK